MKVHNREFVLGVILLLGMFSTFAHADSITLRDGRLIQGKFVGGTQGVIAFTVRGVTEYYDVRNIMVVTFAGQNEDSQEMSPHANALPKLPESGSVLPRYQRIRRKSEIPAIRSVRGNVLKQQSTQLVVERTQ